MKKEMVDFAAFLKYLIEKSPQEFATDKHKGQYRKGPDKQPYINHPARVSKYVKQFKGNSKNIKDIEAAAWLHDTIEDTETSPSEIEDEFGASVASMVKELTSDKDEIKKVGKTVYLQSKLLSMSSYSLVIKLSDRLDNVSDLADSDPSWAAKYAKQTHDILKFLQANRKLTSTQKVLVNAIQKEIQPYI